MPEINPADVQQWFPEECQQRYAKHLIGQSGLTPTQARHFVRLWGYGYLRQHGWEYAPITTLKSRVASFFCSQGDAAKLFYGENQGAPRSAGLMINKFVEKQLVRREPFSGNKTRLSLRIPDSFELPDNEQTQAVHVDIFNPRKDIPLLAQLLEGLFSFDNKRPETMLNNLRKGLREWSKQYPDGLRVLKHSSRNTPIGLAAIFPVDPSSERYFDLPPSQSLYLNRLHLNIEDTIKIAAPGDLNCHVAYIRSWEINRDFWNYDSTLCMLRDTQAMLQKIHHDYPELTDVYTIAIHPRLQAFGLNLGFEVMKSDPDTSLSWLYMALDEFLALDAEDLLLNFDYTRYI